MLNEALQSMLGEHHCHTLRDYDKALHDVAHEIILLSLWRSKFFEHATLCKSSALRLFYDLDHQGESLDFILLKPDPYFDMEKYNSSIEAELQAFGFETEIELNPQIRHGDIKSAFMKEQTFMQRINIRVPSLMMKGNENSVEINVILEVDNNPPLLVQTQAKPLMDPIPFTITLLKESDLFADTIHALLCHGYKNELKAEDWYDFDCFVRKKVPLSLRYLQERLVQSDIITADDDFNRSALYILLNDKVDHEDYMELRGLVKGRGRSKKILSEWSQEYFRDQIRLLEVI